MGSMRLTHVSSYEPSSATAFGLNLWIQRFFQLELLYNSTTLCGSLWQLGQSVLSCSRIFSTGTPNQMSTANDFEDQVLPLTIDKYQQHIQDRFREEQVAYEFRALNRTIEKRKKSGSIKQYNWNAPMPRKLLLDILETINYNNLISAPKQSWNLRRATRFLLVRSLR